GVVASIAVHLGFNATMAVLTVDSPVTQAAVLAVQAVLAITLLATQRDRRTEPPLVQAEAALHPHQAVTEHQAVIEHRAFTEHEAVTEVSPLISPARG
ncbi:hypothetical protein ACFYYH_07660, partial [Streptomyces sp. NPDC002018]|uniref:hypothetical protein n=1 Tax=Streptomyces sp. NPDC002018 TaxID=3364629 RepID=UPI003687588C